MQVSNAELKKINLVSHYFKRAYENDSKVVYVNALIPAEVLIALGVVPFNLGSVGGIFAQGRASTKLINLAQQNHFSGDLCSTSRCIMGAAFKNAMPTPDYLILSSGPCDVDSHLIHTLSLLYEKKWFPLDVPLYYDDREEAISYMESQIRQLVADMEKTLNLRLEPEKLREAVEYSNETISYVQKTSELSKLIPSPVSVVETIDIVSSLHLLGSKEMAEVFKEKYEELQGKARDKKFQGQRKPRVLWRGLRPYYTNEIFDHLENNCNVEVISEMDIYGSSSYEGWELLNPDEPYRSLAKRMLLLSSNYCTANRQFTRHIPLKMDEYSIDGVIAFNSRGCRHIVSLNQVIRSIINENNRPFLELDCDYIDDRDYAFEQIKTRIEAFTELLNGRMQ